MFLCLSPIISIPKFPVLFIGDDILEGLSFTEVYRSFEEMHLLNFSIRGDKTENILWRLRDGELENIKPKVRKVVEVFRMGENLRWFFVDRRLALRHQQQPHRQLGR